MINPNELHIGNRVTVLVPVANGPAERIEVEVYGILKAPLDDPKGQPVIVFHHNGKYYDAFLNENVQGVELTPHLMERCGFITMDNEIDLIDWAKPETEKLFSISQNGIPVEDQPFLFEYENGYCDEVKTEIKHLHQLQNLYRDLTQEELTIK